MSFLWVTLGIGTILGIFYLRKLYHLGTKKAIKDCLNLLIPIALSGIAPRIGRWILNDLLLISYYIAGVGTIIFYIILAPIIQKENTDRYKRIKPQSRWFAVIVGTLSIWVFVSLLYFFVDLFMPNLLPARFGNITLLPIRLLWLFPFAY